MRWKDNGKNMISVGSTLVWICYFMVHRYLGASCNVWSSYTQLRHITMGLNYVIFPILDVCLLIYFHFFFVAEETVPLLRYLTLFYRYRQHISNISFVWNVRSWFAPTRELNPADSFSRHSPLARARGLRSWAARRLCPWVRLNYYSRFRICSHSRCSQLQKFSAKKLRKRSNHGQNMSPRS